MTSGVFATGIKKLKQIWCSLFHDEPMWPIHGQYECRRCHQIHRVAWEDGNEHTRPAIAADPGLSTAAEPAGSLQSLRRA